MNWNQTLNLYCAVNIVCTVACSVYSLVSMCRVLFIVLLSSSGMELFEEALLKWEQALNIRHRTHSGNSTANSLVPEGSELVEHHSVNITHKQQLYSRE